MIDEITRALPHAVGPEKSVLSSMLQDPQEFIGLAIELGLTAKHFYFPSHEALAAVLYDRFEKGVEIEFVSLTQWMLDNGRLAAIGGPSALTDIYTYAPAPGHFKYHLQAVKDKAALRSLIQFCNLTIADAYDAPGEVEQTLDTAEAAMMAIREGRENVKVESIKDAVLWVVEDFQERINGKCEVQGLRTGFDEFDRMTGGLKQGEMYVIAARPSMGKTSFMMNMVEHLSIGQEIPGMVFSLEMTRRQLVQRMIYSRAKFALSQLNRGYAPDKGDLQRIQKSALEINRSNLIVDDLPAITLSQLRAKARRQKREKGIQFIAIDYLQLMRSYTKQATGSREREISEISAGIKGLAKELDLPIIILAQLNRGPESRTGKKVGAPRLSDLRESGAIEQDADMVGLLYRTAYYAATAEDKQNAAGEAELIIAKNRNGETGHIPLTFIADLMRFETGAPYREEQPEMAGTTAGGWDR